MSAFDVSSNEWEGKILSSKTLTAVDFWAPWCPWCMKLKPIFEELAKEYSNKIVFAKVNVDAEQEIASKYSIMGIPVIKFFCDGKEVGELVGYMPKDKLKQEIDKVLETYPQCLSQSSIVKR
ncbi:MAG: thioredoxin [Nitrososphaerales archaeon]